MNWPLIIALVVIGAMFTVGDVMTLRRAPRRVQIMGVVLSILSTAALLVILAKSWPR